MGLSCFTAFDFQILVGAMLNCFGAVLRVVSALPIIPTSSQYTVVLVGQCLCGVAQPFVLFVPTKLAALWFPDSQRAKANTAASMCRL